MGRHFEQQDAAYATYSGFLHMEASRRREYKIVSDSLIINIFFFIIILKHETTKVHTNPILICFCSILYYRDLAEHIHRFKNEKKILAISMMNKENINQNTLDEAEIYFFINKLGGQHAKDSLNRSEPEFSSSRTKKQYKKYLVNKWHVMLRLTRNKELIQYRRHHIKEK